MTSSIHDPTLGLNCHAESIVSENVSSLCCSVGELIGLYRAVNMLGSQMGSGAAAGAEGESEGPPGAAGVFGMM